MPADCNGDGKTRRGGVSRWDMIYHSILRRYICSKAGEDCSRTNRTMMGTEESLRK